MTKEQSSFVRDAVYFEDELPKKVAALILVRKKFPESFN